MSTHYEKLRNGVFIGVFFASAALAAEACGSDSTKDNGTIVIPTPDGSSTTAGGSGGSGGEGGAGGSTGGTGGATGGAAGSGGATGGSAGSGGSSGSGGSGGGGMDSGPADTGSGMCPSSGTYDNSMLPLLPDGGLPPL